MKLPVYVLEALERLDKAGHKGWLVGGCVRDAVMGVEPHDYDIATSALPEETVEAFKDCHVIGTGLKHGTVTAVLSGQPIEITTFRVESEYLDNRHPSSVSFTRRIEDDLCRRDFTINAMAYRPDDGLLDLFGGRKDIENGVIACVGEPAERFGEDGLRIMRALRFASRLGFKLEEKTKTAVLSCADLLRGISAERLFSELCGLIVGRNAWRIVMDYADVLARFIPEIKPLIGFDQNNRYHCYDLLEHTCRAMENSPDDLIVRLALLLHDIGKPVVCFTGEDGYCHYHGHEPEGARMANDILLRLRAPNRIRESVVRLIELHDSAVIADSRHARRLLSRLSFEDANRLLDVKTGDRYAHAEGHRDVSVINSMREIISKINEQEQCFSLNSMAIGGRELIAMGMKPGRAVGRVLESLLEMVISEEIPNEKDALLEAARRMLDDIEE